MRSILPWFVVFAALAGCATPRPDILSKTASHAPTENVEILLEVPARPHKVFALLEDRAGGTPEEVNARFAATGREIGADAIVITEVKTESTTEWILIGTSYYFRRGALGMGYHPVQRTYRSVRAKALKYQ